VAQLIALETPPYYAQIALIDPDEPDSYPQWSTGQESVVFGEFGVAVATRPDEEGNVAIEVWTGEVPRTSGLRLLAQGSIRASAGHLAVGSVAGADLRVVSVQAGMHRVEVHVRGSASGPDLVVFRVD
jgi:hypothetical protein